MNNGILRCLAALTLTLAWALPVGSEELTPQRYQVYEGLVDGDGIQDILLVGREVTTVIAIGSSPVAVGSGKPGALLLKGTPTGAYNPPSKLESFDTSNLNRLNNTCLLYTSPSPRDRG